MNKKQYNSPEVEVLSNTFEDVIVASGEQSTSPKESIALKTDVFDK